MTMVDSPSSSGAAGAETRSSNGELPSVAVFVDTANVSHAVPVLRMVKAIEAKWGARPCRLTIHMVFAEFRRKEFGDDMKWSAEKYPPSQRAQPKKTEGSAFSSGSSSSSPRPPDDSSSSETSTRTSVPPVLNWIGVPSSREGNKHVGERVDDTVFKRAVKDIMLNDSGDHEVALVSNDLFRDMFSRGANFSSQSRAEALFEEAASECRSKRLARTWIASNADLEVLMTALQYNFGKDTLGNVELYPASGGNVNSLKGFLGNNLLRNYIGRRLSLTSWSNGSSLSQLTANGKNTNENRENQSLRLENRGIREANRELQEQIRKLQDRLDEVEARENDMIMEMTILANKWQAKAKEKSNGGDPSMRRDNQQQSRPLVIGRSTSSSSSSIGGPRSPQNKDTNAGLEIQESPFVDTQPSSSAFDLTCVPVVPDIKKKDHANAYYQQGFSPPSSNNFSPDGDSTGRPRKEDRDWKIMPVATLLQDDDLDDDDQHGRRAQMKNSPGGTSFSRSRPCRSPSSGSDISSLARDVANSTALNIDGLSLDEEEDGYTYDKGTRKDSRQHPQEKTTSSKMVPPMKVLSKNPKQTKTQLKNGQHFKWKAKLQSASSSSNSSSANNTLRGSADAVSKSAKTWKKMREPSKLTGPKGEPPTDETCWDYKYKGKCPRGAKCPYIHVDRPR
ncbi:unnamed protein product [Amoebophrya sp. A25]|nr:unnamed protein product [Amoebophrya sp. A25]|eukprot:GSA25T00019569001.1